MDGLGFSTGVDADIKRKRTSVFTVRGKKRFISYRLRGAYEKPWLNDSRLKRTKWNNGIMWGFVILGIIGAGALAFFTMRPYLPVEMCVVMNDEFNQGSIDSSSWNWEVQLDGFGTGSFDWTTTDPKNAYVDGNGLHIVPTLTNETTDINNDELYNGYTLDLLKDGSCTSTSNYSCIATSDPLKGSMIPPVRSARLTTLGKKYIRYGRVEVVAKLPVGDWLWPAIWMMPEDSVYGVWPRSGEIDIMEARGNDGQKYPGGRNIYFSTMHWGPSTSLDAYYLTQQVGIMKRGDFSQGYHTYGLEWTDKYMYTYLNNRLTQILYNPFSSTNTMWQRGSFDNKQENNTIFSNMWGTSTSTTGNAPFDQKFYLILNVAVGSRQGWFLDGVGDKPWINGATNAQWMFYSNADKWLPTWGDGDSRGMTVKSVKMWQRGSCADANN